MNKFIKITIFVFSIFFFTPTTFAQNIGNIDDVDVLRDEIDSRNREIDKIDKEIDGFNKEIETLETEKINLNSVLKGFKVTKDKTTANVRKLQTEIDKSSLEIRRLDLDINEKENELSKTKIILSSLFRNSNENDSEKPFYSFLLVEEQDILSISSIAYDSSYIGSALLEKINELENKQKNLENTKSVQESEKNKLNSSKGELLDQNFILTKNINNQNTLIKNTDKEQDKYEELIADRTAQRKVLELATLEYESRLQFVLDPDSIPEKGAILSWPLKPVRLTQGFGCTTFAKANKGIYGGVCFHPGIDLGASEGTKLTAPLAGIVLGIGNTDEKRGCYSFGKWIAIEHINGLTTIYAHLSLIKVNRGDRLQRGDLIGYTGNSGISTGPHLDFRVYASEGVRIVNYEKINPNTSCRGVSIPTAHKDAKLNPLNYLPPA